MIELKAFWDWHPLFQHRYTAVIYDSVTRVLIDFCSRTHSQRNYSNMDLIFMRWLYQTPSTNLSWTFGKQYLLIYSESCMHAETTKFRHWIQSKEFSELNQQWLTTTNICFSYHQVMTYGCDMICKFDANVSGMKKLATCDWEDLRLQVCSSITSIIECWVDCTCSSMPFQHLKDFSPFRRTILLYENCCLS